MSKAPARLSDESDSLLTPPEVRVEFPFLSPPGNEGGLGRLGQYQILGVLGKGTMGFVFRAREQGLDRLVAVKVMRPELAARPEQEERFRREVRAVARLRHDHIIEIYQVGEESGLPYLVMPLLRGETLQDRLGREGVLLPGDARSLGTQIAFGLAAAHEQNLIHRDIKPSNIWLEPTLAVPPGRVRARILDFGLVHDGTIDGRLTKPGAILGTPAYMSPEQANGETVDGRSDLFALGCTLYHMLVGKAPFAGDNTFVVLRAVNEQHPSAPHEQVRDVPRDLSDLVMRLLAKKPGDRPGSAREVAELLGRMGGEGYTVAVREEEDSRPHPEDSSVRSGVAVLTEQARIEIRINREFSTFSENDKEKLLEVVRRLLEIDGDVRVTDTRPGSVKMTLALTHEQAERLYWAVKGGGLEELDVTDAILVRESGGEGSGERRDPKLPNRALPEPRSEEGPPRSARLRVFPSENLPPPPPGRLGGDEPGEEVGPASGSFGLEVVLDGILSLGLLVVAVPVMAFFGLLIRLTSRGPVLYWQTRLGRGGQSFRLVKLRTMRYNCEARTGAVWSMAGDPRVTPLGRFLRWSHLDELPQLWNVLRGEMSLVGPPPERPEYYPALMAAIPGYIDRLAVRPGITGLAQVHLPPDTDIQSVRRKLRYDLYYIRHRTLWLDLRLIVCALCCLVGVPRRFLQTLLAIPGSEEIEQQGWRLLARAERPGHDTRRTPEEGGTAGMALR